VVHRTFEPAEDIIFFLHFFGVSSNILM